MSQVIANAGISPAQAAARLHEKMLELRLAVVESFRLDKLQAIFDKLIERAMNGCIQSIRLALGYALGRPGAVQAPSRQERMTPAVGDATVNKRVESDSVTVNKRQVCETPSAAVAPTALPQTAAPSAPTTLFTPEEHAKLLRGELPDLSDAPRMQVSTGRPIVNKR